VSNRLNSTKISAPLSFHNVAKCEVRLQHKVLRSTGSNGEHFFAMDIRLYDEDGGAIVLDIYGLGNRPIELAITQPPA
jgi:hypothetical protein